MRAQGLESWIARAVASVCAAALVPACSGSGSSSDSGASASAASDTDTETESATSEGGGSDNTASAGTGTGTGTSAGPSASATADTSDGGATDPSASTSGPTTAPTTAPATTGEICVDGQGSFDFDIEGAPGNVMLVVDKSGSMVNADLYWDHDQNPGTMDVSRWFSVYETVEHVVTSFDASLKLGLVLFPSNDAETVLGPAACVVENPPEVSPALNNANTILSAIPGQGALDIQGGTPMRKGVLSALGVLQALPASEEAAMILITDGSPNCSPTAQGDLELLEYDPGVITTVANAYADDGIPTYVVGIAIKDEEEGNGVNPFDTTNLIAQAGGVALPGPEKFYNTQDQDELIAALDDISSQLISCTLHLDAPPPDDVFVEVQVDGVEYGQVADCGGGNGWQISGAEMTLCGDACDAFQLTGVATINYVCQ